MRSFKRVMNIYKRVRIEEEEQEGQNDLISQLPESILVEILSHLPTLDAVKMASFSRFRDLWTGIRCLSFDQCAFHEHSSYSYSYSYTNHNNGGPNYDERFLNLIRRVLILHERATIDEFHLKFGFNLFYVINHYHYGYESASKVKRMASELTGWIQFALRKQVKVLNIDLIECDTLLNKPEVNYELPSSVLTNKYLMELSLAGFGIKGKGHIKLISLTKLSLKDIKLSDEIMGEIFQGCPMLVDISLNECFGHSKLNMINHNIKSLKIFFGIRNWSELEISCHNIKSLQLSGSIKFAHLKVPCKVSRASLYFSRNFKCECRGYEKIMTLLRMLANAYVFISCTSTALVFTIWTMLRVQIPNVFWKSAEFRLFFTKWHLPGICSILKSSIFLETLTFYIAPGSHLSFKTNEAKWIEEYDFDGKDYLKSQKGCFRCLTKCLKTVNIYGYVTEPFVFELIEFLLKNAEVLERMVISTKKNIKCIHQDKLFEPSVENVESRFTSNELEFSRKLLSLSRASKSVLLLIHCAENAKISRCLLHLISLFLSWG